MVTRLKALLKRGWINLVGIDTQSIDKPLMLLGGDGIVTAQQVTGGGRNVRRIHLEVLTQIFP